MKESVKSWFEEMQGDAGLVASVVDEPLRDGWVVVPKSNVPVRRTDGNYFELVNVGIGEAHREVPAWMQPMLRETVTRDFEGKEISGIVGLIKRPVDEFLVQAKSEPGNNDVPGNVLIAPTVQASLSNVFEHPHKISFLSELGFDGSKKSFEDAITVFQRKDGGRFIDKINLMVYRSIPESVELELPFNYIWATRRDIRKLQHEGYANEHLNEALGIFT